MNSVSMIYDILSPLIEPDPLFHPTGLLDWIVHNADGLFTIGVVVPLQGFVHAVRAFRSWVN